VDLQEIKLSNKHILSLLYWQDWKEWFKGNWNWRNFTFIKLEFESCNYGEEVWRRYELRFGLLGFNFEIDIIRKDTA